MIIKRLDELELIKRGRVFKHCFFILIILLTINMYLIKLDIEIMSQDNMMLCIIFFIISLFCVMMISYDIYPIGEKRLRVMYLLCGLMGILFALLGIYDIAALDKSFIEDGLISSSGVSIILCLPALSIPAAYLVKKILNKKHKEE